MKKINLGATKTNSIQYAVLDDLDMIVAVYFQDMETQSIYRIHIIESSASYVKRIMEFIQND